MTAPVDRDGSAGLTPSARRTPLVVASETASSTYKLMLPPEVLALALRKCVIPADFEPHIATLLEKAPLPMLSQVATQVRDEAALPLGQVWSNMRELASQLKIAREISVTAMLEERHAQDAADVAAGRRSARSLLLVQPGYLDGCTLTPNPNSQYEKPGEGW